MIALVDSIKNFLILILDSSPDSSERAKNSKNGQQSNFIEIYAQLKNWYEKEFDLVHWGKYFPI